MKASDELLELRERCVGIIDRFEMAQTLSATRMVAWKFLDGQTGGVHWWATRPERIHLEVVEMIERAAMAAKEAEGE